MFPDEPDPDDDSIDANFQRFHAAHPEVYHELVRLARQALNAGAGVISMKMLYENVRFQRIIDPDKSRRYALNNVYTSRYARLIMANESDLIGAFHLRELTSK